MGKGLFMPPIMAPFGGRSSLRRHRGGFNGGLGQLPYRGRGAVDHLAVDLGAGRHLQDLVLNIAVDPGQRGEFQAFRYLDIAGDAAVDHSVWHLDATDDASGLTDREYAVTPGIGMY